MLKMISLCLCLNKIQMKNKSNYSFITNEDYQKLVSDAGSTTQLYSVKINIEGEYLCTIYLKMRNGSPEEELIPSESKAISDIVKFHFPTCNEYLIIKKPSRSVD